LLLARRIRDHPEFAMSATPAPKIRSPLAAITPHHIL
jgi:hypothetical protein